MRIAEAGTPNSKSEIRNPKSARLVAPLLVGLVSLGGYLPTLAPSITWKNGGTDGGELALAATWLGIAHPTGYPLYVVLGHLFTWLPWGEPAFRLNLFSATSAAAAAALLATAVDLACPEETPAWMRQVAAAVAGLMLAFGPSLWSQAIITEVYGLHNLFVAANLALLAALSTTKPATHQRAILALGCVSAGLALAHHVTILLLAPGTLFVLIQGRTALPQLRPRHVVLGVMLVLVGASPYLLLPVRAMQQAVANWGDPQTLANFAAHVTARSYAGLLTESSTLTALTRLPPAARMLLEQFGWPGILLIATGCWFLWHRARPLAGHLALSSGLTLLQAIHYRARDSEVYLLPFYVLMALALGLGVMVIGLRIADFGMRISERRPQFRNPQSAIRNRQLIQTAAVAAFALLPLASYVQHRGLVDLHDDYEAIAYTREVLESLPSDAVVFSGDERETFALWYGHDVLGLRPDVLILDTRLLGLSWYRDNLRRRYPTIPWPDGPGPEIARTLDVLQPRPVVFTYRDPTYATVSKGRVFVPDAVTGTPGHGRARRPRSQERLSTAVLVNLPHDYGVMKVQVLDQSTGMPSPWTRGRTRQWYRLAGSSG